MILNKNMSEKTNSFFANETGVLLNFDNNTLSSFDSRSAEIIKVNEKKGRIKIKGRKGKLKYERLTEDSKTVTESKKSSYILKRLDLTNKIEIDELEMSNFLVDQQCSPIKGLDISFLSDKYSINNTYLHKLIHENKSEVGYWFIKKYKENAFIVFNVGMNKPTNIFQIATFSLNGFRLIPLQIENDLKSVTQLRTCL
jgi:hypothetical protein